MYRYAACGGSTTLLNIFIYFITYNYILKKQVFDLGFIAFTPHIAAFIIAFCITFPIGFYLSMYVVFQGSHLRRRIQLIRYFSVALVCIVLNYILIKFFVETMKWYPTPSLIMTAAIVILFSYISQRHKFFKIWIKKIYKLKNDLSYFFMETSHYSAKIKSFFKPNRFLKPVRFELRLSKLRKIC